ncbi:The BURPS668_1122 family of deaminases [Bacillus sp. 491mf]|nr:The BURPS668_1122 family of deaminases [Bacillus sp. 491mf]
MQIETIILKVISIVHTWKSLTKNIEFVNLLGKGTDKVYPTRKIDSVAEAHIIDRVKELRRKLTSGYEKSENFALAEVDVNGIDKSGFFAQSSINELNGVLEERVADILLKPNNPTFKALKAADKNGIEYPRDSDIEYSQTWK